MQNRKISDLLVEDKKVYIYLSNGEISRQFLQDAEDEGFTYDDGVKPTERDVSDLFRIFKDKKMCYVGITGRIAFGSGGSDVVRVDYAKYINNSKDYMYKS